MYPHFFLIISRYWLFKIVSQQLSYCVVYNYVFLRKTMNGYLLLSFYCHFIKYLINHNIFSPNYKSQWNWSQTKFSQINNRVAPYLFLLLTQYT